jgi:hypothetical protein
MPVKQASEVVKDPLTVFQLHIGADAYTRRISSQIEEQICQMVSKYFTSFTVLRGRGFFRGEQEDVLIVKIATTEKDHVWNLAHLLRETLHQDGIGIEANGIYERATVANHKGIKVE